MFGWENKSKVKMEGDLLDSNTGTKDDRGWGESWCLGMYSQAEYEPQCHEVAKKKKSKCNPRSHC